jgi:cell division septation protein DedD
MADEEFHEIHLSGKQLVFLFMATTVVSVVIFLCGVLVGRGVQASRAVEGAVLPSAAAAGAAEGSMAGLAPGAPAGEPPPAASETEEDLSYHGRLESDGPAPEESLAAPAPPPATAAPAPAAAPAPVETEGFVVQVTALRDQTAARALATRLKGKGYPAFVLDPAPGAPAAVYRVRVGPYAERGEAEQIMRRLEREEQFKPIIR